MACTQKDIDDNAKEAQKLGYQFGAHNILILDRKKSDDGTWSITFTIYGDESGVKYTEQWGNTEVMWAPCPSEVAPGSTPSKIGDPPNVDTKGLLYFSKKFLDAHKLSARPKWPLELGADLLPLETLQIFPHSFVLKGLESLSGEEIEIDLLDPFLASERQTIQLDGCQSISVALTPLAIKSLGLPFYPDEPHIVAALMTLKGDRKDRQKTAFAWSVIGAAASAQASGSTPTRVSRETQGQLDAFLFER